MPNDRSERVKKGLENKLAGLKERIARGEFIKDEERVRVAVLADSPTVVTGFGNVCREILGHLYATGLYAFEIVGINYDGSPHDYPYKIYPAVNSLMAEAMYREPYGRQRFLDLIGEGRFDIVWVLQDSFIVGAELAQCIQQTNESLPPETQFQFIYYFPIDATPHKQWIDKSAMYADLPVVYTMYGRNEVEKAYSVSKDTKLKPEEAEKNKKDGEGLMAKLNVIYHGANLSDFYPIEDEQKIKELREKLWAVHKDKFVFANINRNQPRKDLFRTLKAFKILLDRRRAKGKDDVYLYLHCNIFDNNINLIEASEQIDLVQGDEWAFPDPKVFGPASGFPIHVVNEIYNAADAVVSTTLGEGWGLSLTEAMACKRPVIAPDHTSITEILGKTDGGTAERGFLVKTRGQFVQQNDNGRVRPITDEEDLADKMELVMENRKAIQPVVDRAYEWVKSLAWGGSEVGGKWEKLFENAYANALTRRAVMIDKMVAELMKKELGRNEICPVCDIKFKQCRHGK